MSGLPRFAVRHRPFLGLALASILGLAASGCGVTGPSEPLERERERLEQARAQWRSQGILDYRYTFQLSCFCVEDAREPVVVTVVRGTIVSVQREADGTPKDPERYETIEGLFDLIEDSIDQGAASLNVTYDSGLGYPTFAYIDRSEMLADEELGFQTSNLEQQRR